ncbi:hypothetical protein [Bordetella holmesii]|uniref:Uncharacterized protein n=1 Tax=Bordetella holmesii CDC-H585-BH TaxID=1331206 RepID=A0A158M686_9BORD|nr:hypothetical protein [Bordetella holmesii]AMD46865.1 hypothetical protein H558_16015 [Bordetella holmesii H558]AMD50481.1 hypothetical protein F783_002040 [Bordetella holmesii F627]AOB35762.1 hypothetical protein BBB42_09770 [Bordetella holmesii]AUL19730.1 hypothetical protein BTL46_09805 [Bordetella holmesii]AUL23073.1 hypothetical protein BTL48_09885 [Bordetella holmesii]
MHSLRFVALALAAGSSAAQPGPAPAFDPVAERARLGVLGLVQQQVMPRSDGLTDLLPVISTKSM